MDDEDAKHFLLQTRRTIVTALNTDHDLDARFITAFKAICEIAVEALLAKAQNRPMRVP